MIIRNATMDDVEVLTHMSRQFHEYAPHAAMINATDDELADAVRALMTHGCVLVADLHGEVVGMLGAIINPIWFAPRVKIACELAWWVNTEYRGGRAGIMLVKAYEAWAAEQNATVATMSSLQIDLNNAVGKLLHKLGYKESEHTYARRL